MDADPAAPAVLARLGGRIGAFHVQHHPVHRPFRVEQVLRRAHLYVAAGGADSTASSTRVASWSMLRTRRSRSGPAPPSAMKRASPGAQARQGILGHIRHHLQRARAHDASQQLAAAQPVALAQVRITVAQPAGAWRFQAVARRFAVHRDLLRLRLGLALAAPASRVAIRDRSRRRRTAAPVAASAPGFARRWRPAKACPARKRPHGPAARAPRPAGRGQSRRFRRMQRPLLARLQQAAAAHRHGPGREGTSTIRISSSALQRAPAAADSAALPPCADLGPQGTGDEPHDFHQEKKDAQGLDEEVIDQGRDAQEQDQAVDPGGPGEQDQSARRAAGKCSGAGSPSANSRSRRSQRASAKARACRFGICRKSDSRK